jgi:Domain of unknown function (DUF4336)
MLRVAKDLWVHEDSIKLLLVPFGLRMTVVRLTGERLWVHSPTPLSNDLSAELEALGSVAFIVGAANGHNISLSQWHAAYPEAGLYVSPGIPKRIAIENYTRLDDSFVNAWYPQLDHQYIAGVPYFDESVFLHAASKSLIVTDFVQNHPAAAPGGLAGVIKRCVLEPLGFKGLCTPPQLRNPARIKNKAALASSLQTIKAWDFERIIMAHGAMVEADAKRLFDALCDSITD